MTVIRVNIFQKDLLFAMQIGIELKSRYAERKG
jgi:hypothetical protein